MGKNDRSLRYVWLRTSYELLKWVLLLDWIFRCDDIEHKKMRSLTYVAGASIDSISLRIQRWSFHLNRIRNVGEQRNMKVYQEFRYLGQNFHDPQSTAAAFPFQVHFGKSEFYDLVNGGRWLMQTKKYKWNTAEEWK